MIRHRRPSAASTLAILLLLACRGRPAPLAAAATPVPTPVPAVLTLLFPGADGLLHSEARLVPELPVGAASRVRLVVEELLAGSHQGLASPFTWPATLDGVFVDGNGNAYVDLSLPPPGAIEGSATEVALAYATVNSVVANCPEVTRVQLLFGGREVGTLGHLDLARPLLPRAALVAR